MNLSELSNAPTLSDWRLTTGAFLIIALLIFLSKILKDQLKINEEYSRKLVHMLVGVMAALAPLLFSAPVLLLTVAFLFGIINLISITKGFLSGIHSERKSYGTVYFPIAYITLIFLYWNFNKSLITLGILLFAIPDAIAAMIGQKVNSSRRFILIQDEKSLEGSLAMALSSFILLWISFATFNFQFKSQFPLWSIAAIVGLTVTVVETLSAKGSDNFFVPLSGAVLTHIFLIANDAWTWHIIIGFGLALITVVLSHQAKFLNLSGSAMTFLLALCIYGLGGSKWTMPILTFFILSSFLSKAGKRIKLKFKETFEKTGVRDYAQVMANGGIGGVLVIINFFYPDDILYTLYLISLAVSTADTWATEIGVYFKPKPVLITTLKKVEPGVSGAISLHGSLGALSGSGLIILCGSFFHSYNLQQSAILILCGFGGSMIDSIIGATIQGQYHCTTCNKYTEKKTHCHQPTIIHRGCDKINNDLVNLASALFIILTFMAFYRNF